MHDLSYHKRLTVLNLETLEYRRLSSDLTLYYKVFHNLAPWAPSGYFNIVIPPHNLHSVHHDFNIRKPLRRTNIFANDFLPNRCVSAWNGLPSFIVNSKTVASFKRPLVSVDLSKFLVYAV